MVDTCHYFSPLLVISDHVSYQQIMLYMYTVQSGVEFIRVVLLTLSAVAVESNGLNHSQESSNDTGLGNNSAGMFSQSCFLNIVKADFSYR